MKRKRTWILVVIFTSCGVVALAAAISSSSASPRARAEVPGSESGETGVIQLGVREIKPVNVKTALVGTDRLVEVVRAHGVTAPDRDVIFSAEVPGRVERLGPDLGARVKKGQVLARIDFTTLEAQRAAAKAEFDLAQRTYDRLQTLGADLVSRQSLDEAKSRLVGARASLAIAGANLNKSTVRSNVNGIVTAKYVDRAEYVGPGTPLYQVIDYREVVVEAQLPETQVVGIQNGAEVDVAIDALGETFVGRVEAVLPTADPVARTFTVRSRISNSDLRILVGMSASLAITAGVREDVVLIPQDRVIEDVAGRYVFVDDNGTAKKRPIRLGTVQDDRVVVAQGLVPGESLVVVGHRGLSDGQPIRVVE